MDRSFLNVKVISIYLLVLATCRVSYTCSGFSGLGHTYPIGDILIEYNTSTPLEITCVITNETLIQEYRNISSKLYFRKYNSDVPSEKITRLNETSIKLVEENPEKMANFYNCMLGNSVICLNNVAVGTKPQPITDFKCLGYNYENLTCSWTPPLNYIPTNYSLSYTFPKTRAGRNKNDRYPMVNSTNSKTRPQSRPTDCNITNDEATGKKKCFWSLDTKPHYRQVQEQYNFTLKSENQFGQLEQVFLFDHLRNILSGPPENLSCINSTTSSLFLLWKVPNTIVPFPLSLEHRVLYQCKFGPKKWQDGGLVETQYQREVTFNLTGLKHAHDVCDIRVAIRVKGVETEEMWSTNSSVTALTSSTIPGGPPKVNIGSFQTDIASNLRDIYVYWQQIPMEIRNAENFQYSVMVNDASPDNNRFQLTNSYARFSSMPLNVPYKFTIRSKNSEGFSKDSAVIVVPANDKMISEPVSFTKVAFDSGWYKLSWGPPNTGAEYIENYTLFWCSNEKDRPYQCTGFLNWTEVPASTTEYNISVSEDYTTQFAISANNETSSSGMVWATCTLIHNKFITKIKEVWITNVGSTYIDLKWKLDCADRSDSVAGFVIYYCPRAKEPACLKRMNITISNPYAVSGRVTGLTPYTTYMLTVSVINKQGSESLESDPLYNTTYEDVPTEPYGLKAMHITNSSVNVEWEPPKRINGFLRNYDIYFNNNKIDTNTNKTTYTLEYLQGDTEYNISVSACTLRCSNRSAPILIKTKTGHPGRIPNVWTARENNTLVLRWSKPEEIRKHNLYEIRLSYKSDDKNVTLPLLNITGNRYNLVHCEQDNKYVNYYVSVRAVNKDNNVNYTGVWTDELEASCDQKAGDFGLMWIIIVVVLFFVLAVMFIAGKKVYIHFNDMKTVDVKMPPGLDPQIDTNWTQPKPNTMSPSDEEHLLHKTYIPQCGDSSGCSSGQESVTSDSGSSITSTSDSGTEQPRTPTDEEPKTLLMNVSTLKATENQPYVQFPDRMVPWNTNSINTNGYSMYGIFDSNNTDIELFNRSDSGSEQQRTPTDEPKTIQTNVSTLKQAENQPYVQFSERMMH